MTITVHIDFGAGWFFVAGCKVVAVCKDLSALCSNGERVGERCFSLSGAASRCVGVLAVKIPLSPSPLVAHRKVRGEVVFNRANVDWNRYISNAPN
jgi:hypothetical protein